MPERRATLQGFSGCLACSRRSAPGPLCTIAPPYLLRHIAEHASGAQREAARATLDVTQGLRAARFVAAAAASPPRAPSVSAPRRAPRQTHDAGNTQDLPGRLARGERDPATGDAATDEAHDHAGLTRDFLAATFGRSAIDGRGGTLVSTVHYGVDYDNAFWDGRQMVYGDGDGTIFERFTIALDVVAHEFGHGVTEHGPGLIYFEEPGALNEHFSDVLGSLVKQWHLGQDAREADWLIGAGLFRPSVRARALRSMTEPGTAYDDPQIGRDPQVGHMRDMYRGPQDQGGVHINSGIPNRVFATVARALGGRAWERPGRIWWEAFMRRLQARSGFLDAARATIEAAGELDGAAAARAVRAAWREVGVELPRANQVPKPKPRQKPKSKPKPKPKPKRATPAAATRKAVGRSGPGTSKRGSPARSAGGTGRSRSEPKGGRRKPT